MDVAGATRSWGLVKNQPNWKHIICAQIPQESMDKACHTLTNITHFCNSYIEGPPGRWLSPCPQVLKNVPEWVREDTDGGSQNWNPKPYDLPSFSPYSRHFSIDCANRMPLSKLSGLLPRRRTTWMDWVAIQTLMFSLFGIKLCTIEPRKRLDSSGSTNHQQPPNLQAAVSFYPIRHW